MSEPSKLDVDQHLAKKIGKVPARIFGVLLLAWLAYELAGKF
jgi:hypothetical protein